MHFDASFQIFNRYELREDRKHEAGWKDSKMENLKKEIIHTIKGNHGSLSHSASMEGSETIREGSLSQGDLESLKREIISSLRMEIRDVAREAYLSSPPMYNGGLSSDMLPNLNSELYHTHLYTQL